MKKANGNTITYTVREVSVPKKGYEARNDEDGKGNVVITNKHVPKKKLQNNQLLQVHLNQRNRVNLNLKTKPTRAEETRQNLRFLPNTGTTISIISLVLAFVLASIAAYILKKKKK